MRGRPNRRRWPGSPSRNNVNMVVDVARRLAEHGPVVLVGASLGGTTITGVGNTVPDLVDRLVYISVWSCVQRSNPVEYMQEPEFGANLLAPLAGLNVGDPAALGVGRANYRTADPTLLAALKAAVMADGTDEQFRAFLNILQPDESLAVMMADSRGHADPWGTIARTYVRLIGDRSLPSRSSTAPKRPSGAWWTTWMRFAASSSRCCGTGRCR